MMGKKFSLEETGIKNMEADEIDMYVLSDNVYKYDWKTDKMEIAK